MGSMIIMAHKDARLLKPWMEMYREYQADKWSVVQIELFTIKLILFMFLIFLTNYKVLQHRTETSERITATSPGMGLKIQLFFKSQNVQL